MIKRFPCKISHKLLYNVLKTFERALESIFLFGISGMDNDHSKDTMGMEGTILIPHYHFCQLNNISTSICSFISDVYHAFLTAVLVVA